MWYSLLPGWADYCLRCDALDRVEYGHYCLSCGIASPPGSDRCPCGGRVAVRREKKTR